MTQRLLALGTLMAIATIGAHAQKTYTSASSFLADAKLSYSDDFTSVADGAFAGTYTAAGGSGLGFSVAATDGLWSVGGGNISTSSAGNSMTVNFTGGVVAASLPAERTLRLEPDRVAMTVPTNTTLLKLTDGNGFLQWIPVRAIK